MDNYISIKLPKEVRMRTCFLFLQMYYHVSFEGELTLSDVKSLSPLWAQTSVAQPSMACLSRITHNGSKIITFFFFFSQSKTLRKKSHLYFFPSYSSPKKMRWSISLSKSLSYCIINLNQTREIFLWFCITVNLSMKGNRVRRMCSMIKVNILGDNEI